MISVLRRLVAAILGTPRNITNAWLDPVRRRHSISRIVEGYAGGLAVVWFLGVSPWAKPFAALLAPLAEYIVFEYVLEPLGMSGSYWERAPGEGETFTRW